jgi:cyclopropane fatty-acyl-phospholipid synthase-like methyltransferase
MLIINESGDVTRVLRDKLQTPLQQLSADLVGYWKTQTIKTAVGLGIFEVLPSNIKTLFDLTKLPPDALVRLLRALKELGLVYEDKEILYPTEKGLLLRIDDETSLADAAIHWGTEHYLTWMKLTESLKSNRAMYAQDRGEEFFDWVDRDTDILQRYQRAMATYAKHDYKNIADKINLQNNKVIIDAGGGQGVLLSYILEKYQHLQGILLERDEVVKNIKGVLNKEHKFESVGFDLFSKWPKTADVIFLSRVIHDWDNESSVRILKKAKEALQPQGVIYLVEMVLDENSSNGGMLDLNMLVIAGGAERTKRQFADLAKQAGLKVEDVVFLGGINSIVKLVSDN